MIESQLFGTTGAPRPRERILIADDSATVRAQLCDMLSELDDVDIDIAEDGAQALTKARACRPSVLLCDNEMPGISGIQLIRMLRATWSRLELPILMLTAIDATHTKVLALQQGANDYVTKPAERAELKARVMGYLDLRRATREALQAKVELLQHRQYRALGRLAAGMAHELNNPAQATSGHLQFIQHTFESYRQVLDVVQRVQSATDLSAQELQQTLQSYWRKLDLDSLVTETPEALADALEGIRRMATVIGQLTEFAGDVQTEQRAFDLNQAVRKTVEMSRRSRALWPSVSLQLEDGLPQIIGSSQSISQAFLNLLENALDAVADKAAGGRVEITTKRGQNGVEIVFCDNGPGVPVELRPQVFDPFFSTKPLGTGMGQGLFLAHSIVTQQHAGRLSCSSASLGGAQFRVWLPLAQSV